MSVAMARQWQSNGFVGDNDYVGSKAMAMAMAMLVAMTMSNGNGNGNSFVFDFEKGLFFG